MSDDLTMLGPDGIQRSYDEHYDTVMDVEQDPSGAHQAIQRQHARIEELEAKLADAIRIGKDWFEEQKKAHARAVNAEAKLAKSVEIGNKMAASIEGNYYLPGVATDWRKLTGGIDE